MCQVLAQRNQPATYLGQEQASSPLQPLTGRAYPLLGIRSLARFLNSQIHQRDGQLRVCATHLSTLLCLPLLITDNKLQPQQSETLNLTFDILT
jgi:hypothetical protein